jgi:hypothetical protein
LTGARARPQEAPWRAKVQAILAITIGSASLIAGIVLGYLHVHNNAELNAYRAASACAAAADALIGESCAYSGAATVTQSSRQTTLSVELVFAGLSGRSFTAHFATDREPEASSASKGANVTARLWSGKVTTFAGVATSDNPAFLPTDLFLGGVIFAVLGLVGIYWGIGLARNAWR